MILLRLCQFAKYIGDPCRCASDIFQELFTGGIVESPVEFIENTIIDSILPIFFWDKFVLVFVSKVSVFEVIVEAY